VVELRRVGDGARLDAAELPTLLHAAQLQARRGECEERFKESAQLAGHSAAAQLSELVSAASCSLLLSPHNCACDGCPSSLLASRFHVQIVNSGTTADTTTVLVLQLQTDGAESRVRAELESDSESEQHGLHLLQ